MAFQPLIIIRLVCVHLPQHSSSFQHCRNYNFAFVSNISDLIILRWSRASKTLINMTPDCSMMFESDMHMYIETCRTPPICHCDWLARREFKSVVTDWIIFNVQMLTMLLLSVNCLDIVKLLSSVTIRCLADGEISHYREFSQVENIIIRGYGERLSAISSKIMNPLFDHYALGCGQTEPIQ